DDSFSRDVKRKGEIVRESLERLVDLDEKGVLSARGRGMMQALDCTSGDLAARISALAFERGLIMETSGSLDQVLKCLIPLTIRDDELKRGLAILEESVIEALSEIPDGTAVKEKDKLEMEVLA
ncbi:aminotransferase class III-fold pyridoxal phosphate-dependent enzyme, partial [Methanocrinis sp.]|uniref:aminotransferase class III-fold pyridoxal phosphate-dependent enzyme n=1 Tax=Methanocrinis sp. TaxID=3101522 RepID=UPI003D13ED49